MVVTVGNDKPHYSKTKRDESEQLKIGLRVRPLNSKEEQFSISRIVDVADKNTINLKSKKVDKNDHLRFNRNKDEQFVYDLVLGETATQKEVYDLTTKELIQDVINGYNATVFAYGPTGAGKTYTMVGTPEQPGIMIRALNDLFKAMATTKFQISMSYLEIYNEVIRDLLRPSKETLELLEDAKTGIIKVAGLSETSTTSTNEVMTLLTKGNRLRTSEPTAANQTSSRSHALLMITLRHRAQSKDRKAEEMKTGRLYMIDLAGSERAKETLNVGKRLKEGAHINKSLLALGNVINALAEGKAKYVNYRDSKLTRLLKDPLSGNCRTVMIAHVSPGHNHREETRNTLVYADRAKNISKKVSSNEIQVPLKVSQYKTIIDELRQEITVLKNKLGDHDEEVDMTSIEEKSVARRLNSAERMRRLKLELKSLFDQKMSTRKKLMDIDTNILALSMEYDKQDHVVAEWLAEKTRKSKVKTTKDPTRASYGDDIMDIDGDKGEDSEEDPEELVQALEDLEYLEKEQKRYSEMREMIEKELEETKIKTKEMEELLCERSRCQKNLKNIEDKQGKILQTLPEQITREEHRELLVLLCKVHELEIQNVEMESQALIKEHEINRREMLLQRYDRQRSLCEEIITKQRSYIEALQGKTEERRSLSPELRQLYATYQLEMKHRSDSYRFLWERSRAPSVMSLYSSDRLPPIHKESDRLFDKTARRHSLSEEKIPSTPLSLRSPLSSPPSSAPPTASGSRVPYLPPIRGAFFTPPAGANKNDPSVLKTSNSLIDKRFRAKEGSIKSLPSSSNGSSPKAKTPPKSVPKDPSLQRGRPSKPQNKTNVRRGSSLNRATDKTNRPLNSTSIAPGARLEIALKSRSRSHETLSLAHYSPSH